MKASELIQKLRELKHAHGDIDVYVEDTGISVYEIKNVSVEDAFENKYLYITPKFIEED